MFDPSLNNLKCDSLHGVIQRSITEADFDVRSALTKNILVIGGNTMFEGIEKRLENELKAAIPARYQVGITAEPTRKYQTWMGAHLLTTTSSFNDFLVSKAYYEEHGARALFKTINSVD